MRAPTGRYMVASSGSVPRWALAALVVVGCRAEPEVQLVTQVRALTPAPAAQASAAPSSPAASVPAAAPATVDAPGASRCAEAERQARELSAHLPRQLDADTRALQVSARGCDLTLEYQLLTLDASDVAPGGMLAMRDQVIGQLCEDRGARAVFQRGGTFSHVYYDRVHAPIGRFTVGPSDCEATR